MIITNSEARPSIRFIEVVRPYFLSQGYEYNASKKHFSRPFSNGTQYVGFWFRIGVLTSVCLNWHFKFQKLEKLYAAIKGKPLGYKSVFTLGTDMANYTRWEENPQHTFQLYDEATLHYDDFSINKAARKIIVGYEQYTVAYFKQYQEYRDLYEFYSKQDWRQAREIILANYLSVPNADNLINKYRQEVLNRNEADEIEWCDKAIRFIDRHNLKDWLD